MPLFLRKRANYAFFFPNWQQGMHITARTVYMYMYEYQIGAVRVAIHDYTRSQGVHNYNIYATAAH